MDHGGAVLWRGTVTAQELQATATTRASFRNFHLLPPLGTCRDPRALSAFWTLSMDNVNDALPILVTFSFFASLHLSDLQMPQQPNLHGRVTS